MTFYELENICKKRRKFFILIFIFILLIILLIGTILFFVFSKYYFKKKENYSKTQIISKVHKKNKLEKIEKKEKKIKIIKKKNINKDIKYLPIIDLNIKEINITTTKKEKLLKKQIKKNKQINKENNSSIIIKTNTLPSFNTCIELSRKYFKKNNYEEALKWAKLANLQNKKNPISWIMAAESLYKLGKKEEAIKLLKIYNSYYNNKKINELLKELNEK